MIDYHFSDTWADPGHQETPAAWEGMSFEELQNAMTCWLHCTLEELNDKGIEPAMAPLGNEIDPGMIEAVFEGGEDYIGLGLRKGQLCLAFDTGAGPKSLANGSPRVASARSPAAPGASRAVWARGVRAVVQFGVDAALLCPVLGQAMWRLGR